MSIECWKFINSFAPWFSAFGTLLAVAVSLYIALSSRKISIAISSGVFDFDNGNQSLIIKVTNTGFRTVVINNQACICIQAGRFKNKKNIGIGSNYIDQHKTSTFPWRLTEGETAELVVNIKNHNGNWLQNFKKNHLTGIPINTLKIIVFPNVSKPFKESVDSTIITELK
jgi:P pilus assembly chaperone PapD